MRADILRRLNLFRRHERGRPDDRLRLDQILSVELFRDAEVRDFDSTIERSQEQIRRLDVAMDHIFIVERDQSLPHIAQHREDFRFGELTDRIDDRIESLAWHPFHDEVWYFAFHAEIQDAHDSGFVNGGEDLRFASESDESIVGTAVAKKEFDRNRNIEVIVPARVDDPHRTATDGMQQRDPSDARTTIRPRQGMEEIIEHGEFVQFGIRGIGFRSGLSGSNAT